jgi:cell division protein FtsZ
MTVLQRSGTDNVPILETSAAIGGAGAHYAASPSTPAAPAAPTGLAQDFGFGSTGISAGGIHAFAPASTSNTPSPTMSYNGFAASVPTLGSYGTAEMPTIMRNRTQAADKVNALSSGGMEDLEIPAFLRKQAD